MKRERRKSAAAPFLFQTRIAPGEVQLAMERRARNGLAGIRRERSGGVGGYTHRCALAAGAEMATLRGCAGVRMHCRGRVATASSAVRSTSREINPIRSEGTDADRSACLSSTRRAEGHESGRCEAALKPTPPIGPWRSHRIQSSVAHFSRVQCAPYAVLTKLRAGVEVWRAGVRLGRSFASVSSRTWLSARGRVRQAACGSRRLRTIRSGSRRLRAVSGLSRRLLARAHTGGPGSWAPWIARSPRASWRGRPSAPSLRARTGRLAACLGLRQLLA
jgi:hypothetical protein